MLPPHGAGVIETSISSNGTTFDITSLKVATANLVIFSPRLVQQVSFSYTSSCVQFISLGLLHYRRIGGN